MALLSASDVGLVLGGKTLLAGASWRISEGDHVGLVGPNGTGKTTLLRLLAGELEVDGGTLHRRRDLRVGYLPQMVASRHGITVARLVAESVPDKEALRRTANALQAQLEGLVPDDDSQVLQLSAELAEVEQTAADYEARYGEHVAARILAGLGFSESERGRDVGELSGGWQMRAQLAALLFAQPDLLLLDEPTNHLDLPATAWLGAFLGGYRRAYVLVCHDREFLNRHVGRVISFEPERLRSWNGDYNAYVKQREEEREVQEARAAKLADERERAERFIERFRYKASKASAVQSRVKALEKLEDVAITAVRRAVRFRFAPTGRVGDPILSGRSIAKSYGTRSVLAGVDVNVRPGERIAIIGQNGAGKSTLLRILAGELATDAGEVVYGTRASVGFYAQHHADVLAAGDTVYESVATIAPRRSVTEIRTLLGALLFSGDDVDKPVRVLSGGERARVALARLLIEPRSVIMMDEPTNHLDLDSCDALAAALATFDGTLLFVSHNLTFIRALATRIWNVSGGGVETYPGTLDEYLASSLRRLEVPSGSGAVAAPSSRRTGESDRDRRRRAAEARARERVVLGPLETKLAALEGEITALEAEQRRRSELLAEPSVYNGPDGAELSRAYQRDQENLERLTADWEVVGSELEVLRRELATAHE